MRIRISPCLAAAMVLGFSGVASGAEQIEHANVAFDVSPKGDRVVFSSADGDLYLLDLHSLGVSRLTHTRVEEGTPEFSPDGKSVAYSAGGGRASHIFLMSLDGKGVKQLTQGEDTSDSTPSFSPDGSRIAFARAYHFRPYSMGGWTWDDWDICVMNRDGSQARRLTVENYYGAGSLRFLRDGKTLVYSAEGGADIVQSLVSKLFKVSLMGAPSPKVITPEKRGKVVPPNDFGCWGSDPDVSPDGQRLVFISDRDGAYAYDLYLMKMNGAKPVPLGITRISTYNENPVFTPDGQDVLFLAGTESNASSRPIFSLWRVGINGKNARRIADSGLFTHPSRWKPKKRDGGRRR